MKRNRIFWGAVLVLVGGLLLVDRIGIFNIDVWGLFWPAIIILIGGWIILKNFLPKDELEEVPASLALSNIQTANVEVKHGGGRLYLDSGAADMNLFNGTFVGGLEMDDHHTGTNLNLDLEPASDIWKAGSFNFPNEGLKWDLHFNDRVQYRFRIKTGAGDHNFNFRNLDVTDITLETGASATKMVLPAVSDFTKVDVNAGAASVELEVPDGVAAEIRLKSGLSGNSVNQSRFPMIGSDHYRSADYDSAERRVEIEISGGVGSFTVK